MTPASRRPAERPDAAGPRRILLVLSVTGGVVAADQATKAWALSALADGPRYLVGPVRLALTRNRAAAFGLGGAVVPFLALGAVALVVLLVGRTEAVRLPLPAVAAGLVLGGALGNLADRLFRSPGALRGAVVDFVDLRWWPVFNLADAAITCGCLVLVWRGWRSGDRQG
ncbi:MAG: signal peptidase II [Acidimicrobiales bacterium]